MHNQKCTSFIFAFTCCSWSWLGCGHGFIRLSPAYYSLVKMYHLIAMKWKWLVFISHDWCMFWSLMLFKVFLTSAFLLYIFSASVKLKTKPSSSFILYIFTLNSLKLFISFKSFDSSLSLQNKSPAFSYNCHCLSSFVHGWKYSNCFYIKKNNTDTYYFK